MILSEENLIVQNQKRFLQVPVYLLTINSLPGNIYLFKVNNKNTRKKV